MGQMYSDMEIHGANDEPVLKETRRKVEITTASTVAWSKGRQLRPKVNNFHTA